jgi:hypothetical protein
LLSSLTYYCFSHNDVIDIYFFREERSEIREEENASGEMKSPSDNIHRIIGQRWRGIKPDEVRHTDSLRSVKFYNMNNSQQVVMMSA